MNSSIPLDHHASLEFSQLYIVHPTILNRPSASFFPSVGHPHPRLLFEPLGDEGSELDRPDILPIAWGSSTRRRAPSTSYYGACFVQLINYGTSGETLAIVGASHPNCLSQLPALHPSPEQLPGNGTLHEMPQPLTSSPS